jgi:hypothetical protein
MEPFGATAIVSATPKRGYFKAKDLRLRQYYSVLSSVLMIFCFLADWKSQN